eukprot:c15292_g1_i1.p1 GENE.c15292_g1_i1~~c15292_g1_i1.p1  ORF type:complete len:206 (-),score=41.53 c15292_g1_i1:215-832(-)
MVFQQNIKERREPKVAHLIGELSTSSSSDSDFSKQFSNTDSSLSIQIHVGESAVFVTHAGTILAREPTSLLARDVQAKRQSQSFNQIQLRYPNSSSATFMHILAYLRTGIPDFHKLNVNGLDLLEKEAIIFELWGLRERANMERERRRKVNVPHPLGKSASSKSEKEEAINEEMWVDDALLQCCRDTSRDKLPVPDDDLVFEMAL